MVNYIHHENDPVVFKSGPLWFGRQNLTINGMRYVAQVWGFTSSHAIKRLEKVVWHRPTKSNNVKLRS